MPYVCGGDLSMRRLISIVFCISLLIIPSHVYCFSVKESIVRGQRPDALKNHKNGPIAALSQEEIAEAIEFGKANKHRPEVIKYAFMVEKDNTSFLGPIRHVYALICTNYFFDCSVCSLSSEKL